MSPDKPNTPFFTIVVATFNAEQHLAKTIESVLGQSEPAQIVVADGLSKDGTVEIARRYEGENVVVFSEKDRGVYDAWNKGLARAEGEWIIFLGAGDYYAAPDCLARLRAAIARGVGGATIVYGTVELVDDGGRLIRTENRPWEECRARLNRNMPFTHVGTAHHRSVFATRRFDPEFRIAGDYNFLYPLLVQQSVAHVPAYVVQMLDGGLSNTPAARLRLIGELKRIRANHRIPVGLKERAWTAMKEIYWRATRRA